MIYREFLKDVGPDRNDVAFICAVLSTMFVLALGVGSFISIAEGRLSALIAAISVFTGTTLIIAAMFFVGTFIYWAIDGKND